MNMCIIIYFIQSVFCGNIETLSPNISPKIFPKTAALRLYSPLLPTVIGPESYSSAALNCKLCKTIILNILDNNNITIKRISSPIALEE